ncbi:MAG: hypothetical protein K0R67_3153, partial [Paenibacillus sp.]|nr:hypothetical protein [Paenibacillus sp.]
RFSEDRFINNEDCLTKAGGMAERAEYPGARQAGRGEELWRMTWEEP